LKKNTWKKAFFILLGIDVLIVAVLLGLALVPADVPKNLPGSDADSVSFHVKSNKHDLNLLINKYLKEETADSPIAYRVVLGV
jgi:uncharacterized protein YpmS